MAILIKGTVSFCSPFTNIMHKGDTLVPFVSHKKCHKTGNTRHFFLQNENCIQIYSIPYSKYGYPSKIKDFRLCMHVRIYNIKEDFHHAKAAMIYRVCGLDKKSSIISNTTFWCGCRALRKRLSIVFSERYEAIAEDHPSLRSGKQKPSLSTRSFFTWCG